LYLKFLLGKFFRFLRKVEAERDHLLHAVNDKEGQFSFNDALKTLESLKRYSKLFSNLVKVSCQKLSRYNDVDLS
jgi:hypothetical protein